MARAQWKINFTTKAVFRKLFLIKIFKIKTNTIIFNRSSIISKLFINKLWYIHTGLKFNKLLITPLMLGYKIGAFVFTRKPFFFPTKILKKTKLIRR